MDNNLLDYASPKPPKRTKRGKWKVLLVAIGRTEGWRAVLIALGLVVVLFFMLVTLFVIWAFQSGMMRR